eukprot:4060947-Amphidinium_carterae.1
MVKRLKALFAEQPIAAKMCKEHLEKKGFRLPETSKRVKRALSKTFATPDKDDKDDIDDKDVGSTTTRGSVESSTKKRPR